MMAAQQASNNDQTQNPIMSIELAYWLEVRHETILRSGGSKAIAKVDEVIAEIKAEHAIIPQISPLQA